MKQSKSSLVIVLLLATVSIAITLDRPHIILIVADDLGWNDVGFHGSKQIPTPNIDSLAYDGIILNNYYVSPICTPTRGALLSGRHPIHTGLQHSVIVASQPYGLPLNETIMPQYLAKLGYRRHMIGKWHIGFHHKEYTPLYRGFESHYGYYLGCGDYYDHTSEAMEGYFGFDFWRNESVDISAIGHYSTTLFKDEAIRVIQHHDSKEPLFLYLPFQAVHSGNLPSGLPLQAPSKYINKFSKIKNKQRRSFAGMVSALDDAVGDIVNQLKKSNMYNNSIIVFTTDNGGPANGFDGNAASNQPLRGVKATLWEGGVRGVGFISSPLLNKSGYVAEQMMHVTDWLPTLYAAAGGNPADIKVTDGLNLWPTLQTNGANVRTEILHNIDPLLGKAAIRVGDYKLLLGNINMQWDGWYPAWQEPQDSCGDLNNKMELKDIAVENLYHDNKIADMSSLYRQDKGTPVKVKCGLKPANVTTNCDPKANPCLYHIPSDPCEYHNIADLNKAKVGELLDRLIVYYDTMVPPLNKPIDPAGNPSNNGGIWKPWLK